MSMLIRFLRSFLAARHVQKSIGGDPHTQRTKPEKRHENQGTRRLAGGLQDGRLLGIGCSGSSRLLTVSGSACQANHPATERLAGFV